MRKSNLLFWVILWLFAGGATAQTVKNPLSIVAEYNLKSDGTFANGDVLSAFGNYFKWAEVKNLSLPLSYPYERGVGSNLGSVSVRPNYSKSVSRPELENR